MKMVLRAGPLSEVAKAVVCKVGGGMRMGTGRRYFGDETGGLEHASNERISSHSNSDIQTTSPSTKTTSHTNGASSKGITTTSSTGGIQIVSSSRPFNPLAPDEDTDTPELANMIAVGQMEAIANARRGLDRPGLRFELPQLPLESKKHIKHRYEPIVDQVTGLIMRHGKLGVAQRNLSFVLNYLRTSPPPVISSTRPLLPNSPPPSHLPLNPILYLTLAIDSVAPLLRIRSQKGGAGGGVASQIPVPLGLKQRRRTAIGWILDAANKKKSRGSGKTQFAQRIAEEIIAVAEGRSTAWDRRALVHKTGTGARANLTSRPRIKR